MNHSGDAAEQIVRMSLEGVEVAAKITGSAAKEIALFLLAALKSPDKKSNLKLKGKARMASMLKSGKALEIFSIREDDLRKFAQGAKQYGIVYCVLRNTKNSPDGLCDIMVKADDAPKISRLVERFQFATVDKAKIESEIVAERAERAAADMEVTPGAEPEAPDINDTDKLLDELLGPDEGRAEPDIPEPEKADAPGKEPPTPRPLADGGPEPLNSNQSEPSSGNRKNSAKRSSSKPSVKEELREITAAIKAKEADAPKRDERPADDKAKKAPATTTHKQPQRGKNKSKKQKGSR
ncbi:MAG: PcfB family protein [Oscillospiraceae bacterium]|jgi:hypothetical protein|nr:PcfB family protein [Oscillospiraceae bacterium]